MKTEAAQVAALIRKQLKAHGIAGSVKSSNFSMGDSVTVKLVDALPNTYEKVKTFCRKFEAGSFDSMTDCYNYDHERDNSIPSVKYVLVSNDLSDDTLQAIREWVAERFSHRTQFNFEEMIWDVVRNYDNRYSDFWSTRKQRITA